MIVYSVICRARDAAVLVEVSSDSSDGNVPQVTLALLEHLSQAGPQAIGERDLKTYVHRNEQKGAGDIFSQVVQACTTMSIQTKEELDLGDEEHFFHLWTEDGVFYCCLSDDPDPRRHKVAFAFLQNVARDFAGTFSARKIKNCNAYAMDKQFAPNLRSSMHYYNINHDKLSRDQKVNELMAQVEDMKTVLGRNLHLLLDRETKLNNLLETSQQAKRDSLVFRKRSKSIRMQYRNRNTKLWLLIGGTLFLILYTIAATKCGVVFQSCLKGE